jgi:hypothetical protein
MATAIKNGQTITLSTTETAYELHVTSDRGLGQTTLVITFVSGSFQATVAAISAAPILNNTFATWSTTGDKVLLSFDPGTSNLRMRTASAGVVNVSW